MACMQPDFVVLPFGVIIIIENDELITAVNESNVQAAGTRIYNTDTATNYR